MSDYSEDALVEQPAIALFQELGWQTANCFNETFGPNGTLGRETSSDVVLVRRLRPVIAALNPTLPGEALDFAIEELTRDRSAMSAAQANREVYKLLKDGVKVYYEDLGEEVVETVRVIDWSEPGNNDFFLASQFWVTGDMYKRRADLVGFVNGIPLLFVELKKAHGRLENAYKSNLRDYKDTIPQLFWYNAFIILSNGADTRIGSSTAEWEHFAEWKKINSEGEEGIVSLETAIRGTCEQSRFLDLVENFVIYSDTGGALIKLIAKNHQFLGVNNAIQAVNHIRANHGRLGVFWHTQGSGKSFSMVFFSQKVLRKLPGNWTFLIVTDRLELDDQIYKNFARAGMVTEAEDKVRADSGEHLKTLLQEDHRYLFTIIHKFHNRDGEPYPKLSDRSDIIVMTDEAHRSQYDVLAMNMRKALPNAAFIGFTGTPLMVGEELTRQVFGDYVSIYNFKQSIDDGATVPLYYENRIPELQLSNEDLNDDIQSVIEEAELNEEEEVKLEREFRREYHLITREDRLEKIADDIVSHFIGRGYQGKAMVVSIDKLTAVKIYEKVRTHWERYIEDLGEQLQHSDDLDRDEIRETIDYMRETDMAVVISQAQNEISFFQERGLDILPHRQRMMKEDLDTKFKEPNDSLRIVFVCAMWMTGFDVPSCSTIYLDKPMRNHTLMQTIARANRVYGDKQSGVIVDYIGVFRNLQKALAIYGTGSGGGVGPGETPVVDKSALVECLRAAIAETRAFCEERGVDVDAILASEAFHRVKFLDDAAKALVEAEFLEDVDDSADKILVNDELKKQYLSLTALVVRLYKAILPDPAAEEFAPLKTLFAVIAERIRTFSGEVDITGLMESIEEVLDTSVTAEGYVIREPSEEYGLVDLSMIDFEALKKHFEQGHKRIEAERLRGRLNEKLARMVTANRTRMDFYEEFQRMIDEYNSGSANIEAFFDELVEFAKKLNAEEARTIAESLSEEELALFDLLTKPEMELADKEREQVKLAARELLERLKKEKLVLDWRKRQQTRADVRLTIEQMLDMMLPRAYSPETYQVKCDTVYRHVYDSYFGQGRSIYGTA